MNDKVKGTVARRNSRIDNPRTIGGGIRRYQTYDWETVESEGQMLVWAQEGNAPNATIGIGSFDPPDSVRKMQNSARQRNDRREPEDKLIYHIGIWRTYRPDLELIWAYGHRRDMECDTGPVPCWGPEDFDSLPEYIDVPEEDES